MSHPSNTLIAEYKQDRAQGAYNRTITYPEGSVIDGIPIISDTYLEKLEEQKEIEKLKTWDETEGIIKDIF